MKKKLGLGPEHLNHTEEKRNKGEVGRGRRVFKEGKILIYRSPKKSQSEIQESWKKRAEEGLLFIQGPGAGGMKKNEGNWGCLNWSYFSVENTRTNLAKGGWTLLKG